MSAPSRASFRRRMRTGLTISPSAPEPSIRSSGTSLVSTGRACPMRATWAPSRRDRRRGRVRTRDAGRLRSLTVFAVFRADRRGRECRRLRAPASPIEPSERFRHRCRSPASAAAAPVAISTTGRACPTSTSLARPPQACDAPGLGPSPGSSERPCAAWRFRERHGALARARRARG